MAGDRRSEDEGSVEERLARIEELLSQGRTGGGGVGCLGLVLLLYIISQVVKIRELLGG